MKLAALWRNLLRRHDVEADLDEELRETFRLLVEQKIRAGQFPEDAHRAARREFGSPHALKDKIRDVRAGAFVDTFLLDVRYAVRLLRRNPGFTIVAILALGLGIGVSTAVFTAYKAIVARPLDARNPDEMVDLALRHPSGSQQFTFSYPDYEAYRDSSHSFSGLIAFMTDRLALSDAGGAIPSGTRVRLAFTFVVSENYFKVLGVNASRGRTFDSIARRVAS